MSDSFVNWLFEEFKFPLCDLYKPPYNFERTGCCGCPLNRYLKQDLQKLIKFQPTVAKQAYSIWRAVYDEYARLNYRIDRALLSEIAT